MDFLSPAKVNLFLKICHKRPDGYHELASLMQAIDLCDTLSIFPSSQDTFTCSDPALPTDGRNLIIKARDLFRSKTQSQTPLSIHLEKKVPYQAGLGGGSGNAATTLWAMNHLLQTNISEEQLQQWSSEIGSDIPFFFTSGTAYCTGRGEITQNIQPQPTKMWIIKPAIGLGTVDVFRRFKLRDSFDPHTALQDYHSGKLVYMNDLVDAAEELAPSLKELRKTLIDQNFKNVQMSGSGSAYFCHGDKKPEVAADCYSVKTIQRQPGSWYL